MDHGIMNSFFFLLLYHILYYIKVTDMKIISDRQFFVFRSGDNDK